MARNGPSKSELKREREAEVFDYLLDRASELRGQQQVLRNRSVAVVATRNQLFQEQLNTALEKLLANKYVVGAQYKPKKKVQTQRILNVMLSDLHYGAMLDGREVPLEYGPTEEARRTAAVAVQVAEYKPQYRDETELYIHIMGDIIQNQLHDPRDGQPLAHQASAAVHLLTQFVLFQASHFKKVTVFCTPGNHGRFKSRHPDRATNQKWDSLENLVYFSVKTATRHQPNVEVHIPYTPFYTYEAFGMSGFMTHGDTVIKPGFPGSSIDVNGVRKQINEINSKRETSKRHSLFGVGHVHTYSCTKLGGGIYFMTNGCLIPTDAFAQSIGIIDTACCQSIWETVPGRMVGDRREADVNEYTDKDKALDKVIQAFTGF